MKFNSVAKFNKYVGLMPAKSEKIDVGKYEEHTNLRLQSDAIYPNFYRISLKYDLNNFLDTIVKPEDAHKGFMYFSGPQQMLSWETDKPWTGYYINLSQELISENQHLEYSFLNYGMHEALFLKEDEERHIKTLYEQMVNEYRKNNFAVEILSAYCNLMFAYVAKFYERQFGENEEKSNYLVSEFRHLLHNFYLKNKEKNVQFPSVASFAEKLHVTPNYLSDVLKYHTGKPALEHIHEQVVSTAQQLLKQKKQTVSEIAYQLGFEYPNYFARLFKKKTGISPSLFRNQ